MLKRCATIALGIVATTAAVLALATAGSAAPDQNTWGNNGAWNNSNPSHGWRNGDRNGNGNGYANGRQHWRDNGGGGWRSDRDDRRHNRDRDDRRRYRDRDDRGRHHHDRD